MKNQEQQRETPDEERVDEIVEAMKGKSDDEFSGKTFDELLKEIEAVGEEIIRLLVADNDWKKIQPELQKKIMYLNYLQLELAKRPKKAGDYSKWAQALAAERQGSLVAEARNIKEREKELKKNFDELEEIKEMNDLSLGERLQWKMIASLEETNYYNFTSSAMTRIRAIKDNIPAFQFQAEIAEVMLEVREEQAKTANILEKVEERLREVGSQQKLTTDILEKVAANTDSKQQFKLIVAASALVTLSVGFVVELVLRGWGNEIVALLKEHWLRAILWTLVLVFAGLEIGTRVKKKKQL